MTERDFIAQIFSNAFKGFSNKRIVLYGLSTATKTIIELFSQYNFIGLMDGYQEQGEQYGRPILSLSAVADLKPDCIIIIARTNSTKIIAKRIHEFCLSQKIDLYDIQGEDLLLSQTVDVINNDYFSLSRIDIEHQIQNHEVISFDIFDTLLMRKVLFPEDIFTLVEQKTGIVGFKIARVQAERQLNQYGAPDINAIYNLLQDKMNLDEVSCAYLMEVEFETERENLIVRDSIVQLLNYAVSAGKKVYLISDMYWSSKQIQLILKMKGILGYQRMFVSSDYHTFKTEYLYKVFKQEVKAESYLHIGDKKEADILFPGFYGIDSIQIYSALDLLEISSARELLNQVTNFEERMMLGLLVARLLNNPFSLYQSKGKISICSGYDLGYCLLAPMLTAFLLWLIQDDENQNSQILFGARDGYILDKMCSILKKSFPEREWGVHTYFYISRMAAVCAGLKSRNDILYAARVSFEGRPEELLRKRFCLEENEILFKYENEAIEDYVLRHEKIILQRALEKRTQYLKYIKSLNIEKDRAVIFFDFVSSGTCQMCLEEILEKKIKGKYFIHFFEDYTKKQKLDIDSFFEEGLLYDLKSYLSTNYLLVESIIVSLQPTLKGFSEEGMPFFIEENRTDAELEYVQQVQQGILDYFAEYIKIVQLDKNPKIRSSFVDQIYSLLKKKYTNVENCVLGKDITRDEFCNRKYVMNNILD